MNEPQRYGVCIRLRPERRAEYLRLHAAVWPQVEQTLRSAGIRNYTIFEHGELLFGYYEFVGTDHAEAQARIAADPVTRRWWQATDPCQERLPGTPQGAQWAPMTEVWHLADTPGPAAAVVDAHVHLWDPDVLPYPWLDGTPLRRRFDAADFAAAAAPVGRFVAVQADTTAEHSVDEVRWLAGAGGGGLVGIVAHAPVEAGAAVASRIEQVLAAGPVVGIRRLLQDDPAALMAEPAFDEGLRVLAGFGLPFDLCVREHQLPEVVRLVERHPEQSFVLDHLGKPRVGADDARPPWRRAMERLAAHPGVSVKLSGLAGELVPGAVLAAARPYLDDALELFGPQRCLFGSDWPVVTTAATHAEWRELVEAAVAPLGPGAVADVFGGTALRTYRPTRRVS